MKNAFKAIVGSFLVFTIMAFILPSTVSAAASPIYPTTINGLPVILVETSANNVSLKEGHVTLVLLDTSSTTLKESMAKFTLNDYLTNNPLPSNWLVEVYGGSGVTAEGIIEIQKENNDLQKQYGVDMLGPLQSDLSQSNISPDENTGSFADDENVDPQQIELNLQSCNIIAPSLNWTKYISNFAYFGDNVITNASNPFGGGGNYALQSGQIYAYGDNQLVYASSNDGLASHDFSLTYVPNCNYLHEIYYCTNDLNGYTEWMMAVCNENSNQWGYAPEYCAYGTYIDQAYQQLNNGVFFENHFTDSSWYKGFNNNYTVSAYLAQEGYGFVSNGVWTGSISSWSTDFCYPGNEMSGSLAYYGTTTWLLSTIPLGH